MIVEEPERNVTSTQLAEAMGVHPRTVRNWVEGKDGLPHERGQDLEYLFNLEEAKAWHLANRRQTGKKVDADGEEPKDAKERKLWYEARKVKLQVLKAEGLLLDASEVRSANVAKVAAVRHGLLSQPTQNATRLFACETVRELELIWLELNRGLLREFAGEELADGV